MTLMDGHGYCSHPMVHSPTVKYHPYGQWGHFSKWIFGKKPCHTDNGSSTPDSNSGFDSYSDGDSEWESDSSSDIGSSMTSC